MDHQCPACRSTVQSSLSLRPLSAGCHFGSTGRDLAIFCCARRLLLFLFLFFFSFQFEGRPSAYRSHTIFIQICVGECLLTWVLERARVRGCMSGCARTCVCVCVWCLLRRMTITDSKQFLSKSTDKQPSYKKIQGSKHSFFKY